MQEKEKEQESLKWSRVLELRKQLAEAEKSRDKKAIVKLRKKLEKEYAEIESAMSFDIRKKVLMELHAQGLVKLVFYCTDCGHSSTEPMEKCKHCGGSVDVIEIKKEK